LVSDVSLPEVLFATVGVVASFKVEISGKVAVLGCVSSGSTGSIRSIFSVTSSGSSLELNTASEAGSFFDEIDLVKSLLL
tara:strand:+ start:16152 stop:16391 length:240 start_codon:yes stop_codon:yes gene_type:complete